MIELGLGAIHDLDDERLQFAQQLGVQNIIVHTPPLTAAWPQGDASREAVGGGYWEFLDLLQMRRRVDAAGLKLYAIENIPMEFYDKIRLGLPGRDQQIENVCRTIRNMGRAGIPVLGYHWMLVGVWRTERTPTGRGGAVVTKYDHELVKNAPTFAYGEFDDETMWENFEYFLKAVVPVAEEAGVRLALHPDDPPVPNIAGTARIIRSTEAYKRVIGIVDSPSNCLEFCQGTVSEWCETPEEVYEAIRYFSSRNKIAYVHFRNVRGVVPKFEETFIDEGKVDMLKAMRAYKESDFDGVLIVDHTPGIVGDTGWGHRGRAYGIGYIKALLKCVNEA
ncbi:MAG: mannonate dehydratase [Chloroflexota bacterium]|nr:mannonate dehydratase [Chloroflexota bacterium]